MADKQLTESAWKAFAKGKNYKDSAFAKALSEFEKSEKGSPDDQLEALDDVEKQAAALEKAYKADKALADYIGDVEKALKKARKDAERQAEAAAEAEEEDNEPALLTTKMVPLLRQVKKGDVMQAMVAVAGKQTAVLLARRAISPAKRKLLAEYMGSPGGIKYHKGECGQGEGNAVLFMMETGGGGGLAKKLRQALLDQTGLRVQVKMRAADTGEEEDDGEGEGDDAADGGAATAEQNTADALARVYDQRSAALEPRVLDALRGRGADSSRIRAVSMFAGEKRGSGDLTAALKALDTLEGLLAASEKGGTPGTTAATPAAGGATAAAPESADTTVDPAAAFKVRLAALMPKVQQAIATDGPEAGQVKAKTASAGAAAQRKEFGIAGALLDEVEELIAKAAGAGLGGIDQAALWDQRVDEVEQMLQRLLKVNAAEGEKARKVMAFARGKATAGSHAQALAALDQVAKMIAAADATPTRSGEGGYKGIVKYRTSLIEFRRAAGTVESQIDALRKAIPAQMPDEGDLADELSSTLKALTASMLEMVDEAMNTADDQATPITRELASRIQAFQDEVASSELVKHVDGNPFGVKVAVAQTLGPALAAVRAAMPAPV
jgi:hypothetical protein